MASSLFGHHQSDLKSLRCIRCGPSDFVAVEQTHCPDCGAHLENAPIHQAAQANVTLRQNDNAFVAPYFYERSLLTVPGKATAVPMVSGHTDEVAQAIREIFIPRDSDIWVATYPKSGTTWVQEMLSLMLYGEGNAAQGRELGVGLSTEEHILWLEALCAIQAQASSPIPTLTPTSAPPSTSPPPLDSTSATITATSTTATAGAGADAISAAIKPLLEKVNNQEQRRCFKSHSPLGLLQTMLTPRSKIIHVARNPKDVAVSMWHHTCSKNFGYDGPWPHFLEKLFLSGEVESGPWWDFVLPYVLRERRQEGRTKVSETETETSDQVLTVWYEDLVDNPRRELIRMAAFLDISIKDDCEHDNENENKDDVSGKRVNNSGIDEAGEQNQTDRGSDPLSVTAIIEACSFSAMQGREQTGGLRLPGRVTLADTSKSAEKEEKGSAVSSCRNHIRKGGKGGWRKYFTVEQEVMFDAVHAQWLQKYDATMELQFE